MDKTIQKTGLVNLLTLLFVAGFSTGISRQTVSLTDDLATAFLWLGFLAAAVSYFQIRLENRERVEKLEMEDLARTAGRTSLFESGEEILPAFRARAQFEKWLVPVFTALLLALQGLAAWHFWRQTNNPAAAHDTSPQVMLAALYGFFFFGQFLLGKYAARFARLEGQRLLRPAAGYLLLGGYLSLIAAVSLVARYFQYGWLDLLLSRALCVLLTLVAVENLLTLVLEIYRPRVSRAAARVLYESRLIGLLGEPEGILSTAAHALDYQFGFKVSETWFYRVLERTLAWIILAQIGILLLSTCFVFIQPGEQALLERFGQPVAGREVIGPGAHFKWPWPVDQVYRYPTWKIQSFNVGFLPNDQDGHSDAERTVVWTRQHYKEEFNFPVASAEITPGAADGPQDDNAAPPVNLLTASIPVQFQVTNLAQWARGHVNGQELLERAATREVLRHLVSVDIFDIMSTGRAPAADELRRRIQASADRLNLGVRILLVGLQDIHPPVKVAPSFEKVIGAQQEKEAKILTALGDQAKTNALALGEAVAVTNRAAAFAALRTAQAHAQAAQFTNQLTAFAAAPTVFPQRTLLLTLERAIGGARKYVLATTNVQEFIQLNLEEKIRQDMLDLDLAQPEELKKK